MPFPCLFIFQNSLTMLFPYFFFSSYMIPLFFHAHLIFPKVFHAFSMVCFINYMIPCFFHFLYHGFHAFFIREDLTSSEWSRIIPRSYKILFQDLTSSEWRRLITRSYKILFVFQSECFYLRKMFSLCLTVKEEVVRAEI